MLNIYSLILGVQCLSIRYFVYATGVALMQLVNSSLCSYVLYSVDRVVFKPYLCHNSVLAKRYELTCTHNIK